MSVELVRVFIGR